MLKLWEHLTYPTPIPGIQRIDMMKILGVSLSTPRLMHIATLLSDRQRSRCMRSEFSVHTVLTGKPFGTSPALPRWPECCMHHRRGGDMLIWAIDSDCKTSYSNCRGWDFCHAIPFIWRYMWHRWWSPFCIRAQERVPCTGTTRSSD